MAKLQRKRELPNIISHSILFMEVFIGCMLSIMKYNCVNELGYSAPRDQMTTDTVMIMETDIVAVSITFFESQTYRKPASHYYLLQLLEVEDTSAVNITE